MRSTIKRSAARSASVTRSMSPSFDTCSARPDLSASTRPASRAVWIALLSESIPLPVGVAAPPPEQEALELKGDDAAGGEQQAELQRAGRGLGQLICEEVAEAVVRPLDQ